MDGKNKLYFGDNLKILRKHQNDASVDLIPQGGTRPLIPAPGSLCVALPFRAAHAGLKPSATAAGEESAAQIMAFEDTWQWSQEAEGVYRKSPSPGRASWQPEFICASAQCSWSLPDSRRRMLVAKLNSQFELTMGSSKWEKPTAGNH